MGNSLSVTVITAAAGYGKTTVADRLVPGARWYRAGDAAGLIRGGWPDPCPPALVLDDPAVPPAELGAWLERAADSLPARLVVLTRHPVPVTGLRASGRIAELGAAELALTPAQVRTVLDEHGIADPWLATGVHEATAGWPMLVRLAGEALAGDREAPGRLAETLALPGKPVARYLAVEVLAELSPANRRAVRILSRLELITEDLCRRIGEPAPLDELAAHGLLLSTSDGAYRMVPVLAAVAARTLPLSDVDTLAAAASWYSDHGQPGSAARAYLGAGDSAAAAGVLEDHGAATLAAEGADAVLGLVTRIPPGHRSRAVALLHAEALALAGDIDGAQAVCDPLDGGEDTVDPDLARVLGHLEYRRGNPRRAVRQYLRGRVSTGTAPGEALLLAWTAVAHWAAGDQEDCRRTAAAALRAAEAAGDARALVASQLAMGFAAELTGDCAAEQRYYERALELADAAGDVVSGARIRANQASRLIGEARYAEATRVAEAAIGQAERVGYASVLGIALCNGGEALLRLGRLDEATERFERALAHEHRTGSRRLAYPLTGLGDLHRVRDQPSLARARYEEAVRICGAEGDRQGLLPALTGLAGTRAGGLPVRPARVLRRGVRVGAGQRAGADPHAAAEYARWAHREAAGPAVVAALLALGWVADAAGERDRAAGLAAEAAAQARLHRDRANLAGALELAARNETSPAAARRALTEALAIWRDAGARLDVLRVTALLGALLGARPGEALEARLARQSLAAAGVRPPGELPAPAVEIRTLGRFEVRVGGEPLPASAWQSRKARDLLRILVARRGRGLAREELGALLWNDEDPARVGHRLSVALSTVRATLNPDRTPAGNTYILADQVTVALNLPGLWIDIEEFFLAAEHGFRLERAGDRVQARAVLVDAERLYDGDLFEDEPYDDWSAPTREEARATYLRVARTLAGLCLEASDVDDAVRYLQRILAKDPYDERGHRDLVDTLTAAGRHGESQRARARYAQAMSRLSV